MCECYDANCNYPIIKYHCRKCNGLNVWRSILGKEFINEPDLDNEIFQEDRQYCDDCNDWVDIRPVEQKQEK